MRKFRYMLEAAGLWILMNILGLLPPRTSSNFGAWVGRTFGPHFKSNKKGLFNLQLAFPEKSHEEHLQILNGMWENLGRVIAEYPHLERLSKENVKILNTQYLDEAMAQDNGVVFISGHIGNWELKVISVYTQFNHKVAVTYRAPNNPWSDKMLHKIRTLNGRLSAHSKSAEGGRGMMKDLRNKGMVGILVDQKYNEGLSMPFFNHPAMTNPIFVQLAQKFKCPLLPVVCRRVDGCDFEISLSPPVALFDGNDQPRAVEDVISDVHALLEQWIRETPEQWLWIHKRWRDDVYE